VGPEAVVIDMTNRGIPEAAARDVLDKSLDIADKLSRDYFALEPAAADAADNLRAIIDLCQSTPAKGHVTFTPRLARGLSYYTGAIMEIAVPDLAGSLGGGGRYDGLIGMFCGEQIPACGFSLGLERILVVMTERNMFPAGVQTSGPDVLVTIFDEELTVASLALATELRAARLRVEVYPEPLKGGKNLGKAFKYADSRQARFVSVMGQDEFKIGAVKIKNMKTGEQQAVARGTVAEIIRAARLAPQASDSE
jgi:histidyl-tRNA synthetase